MKDLIKNAPSPLIIDADGINALQGERKIFSHTRVPVILTPHPGEMARLLMDKRGKGKAWKGVDIKNPGTGNKRSIEQHSIDTALSFARETKTYLVLKCIPTIIATPDGRAFINSTGNPGMATAGAGDVLTGIIAGFLSQTMDPLSSCSLGVFMHGLAGDIVASAKGMHPLTATDIIESIPGAFSALIDYGRLDLS